MHANTDIRVPSKKDKIDHPSSDNVEKKKKAFKSRNLFQQRKKIRIPFLPSGFSNQADEHAPNSDYSYFHISPPI